MLQRCLLIGLCLSQVAAFAITRRDDRSSADFINLGAPFTSVVRLNLRTTTDDFRSGVLIGDKFILTAAHNTPNASHTPTFLINGQTYNVAAWSKHASYNGSNVLNGFDVSVARLDRRVVDVMPVGLFPLNSEAGMTGTIVGYGATGTGTAGINLYDWLRRAGTNAVDFDPTYPNVFFTDFDDPLNAAANSLGFMGSSPTATVNEGLIAFGDSGGPLLLEANGQLTVAGIASAIGQFDGNLNAGYSDYGVYTRVAPLRTWIQDRTWENGRIQGTATILGFLGNPNSITVTAKIRTPGTQNALQTDSIVMALDRSISFTTALRGTYDISLDAPHYLRVLRTNVTITNNDPRPFTYTLVAGDINDDEEIGPGDFALLSVAFGSESGSPNWNPAADIDRDGEVGPGDFAILSLNFGLEGAP